MSGARHLGMRPGELDGKPYARHWNPVMAPLSANAREALARGPIAGPLLPPLDRAPALLEPGDQPVEDGIAMQDDGAMHVAVRTAMPGATARMVDWWFGWHSDEPQRYKLWHPQAHVHAEWQAPARPPLRGYVGRVSFVDEYVGSKLGRYAIRFVPPRTLGFDESALEAADATAVCARVGFAGTPVDFGHLVHHVRPVVGGCEMRSRFWIGGPSAAARGRNVGAALAIPLARRLLRPTPNDGHALLVHCAQEMSHLASFLPRLHADLAVGG
jgi:hypothetical protein